MRRYYITHESKKCGSDYTRIVDASSDHMISLIAKSRLGVYAIKGRWIISTPKNHNHYGECRLVSSIIVE